MWWVERVGGGTAHAKKVIVVYLIVTFGLDAAELRYVMLTTSSARQDDGRQAQTQKTVYLPFNTLPSLVLHHLPASTSAHSTTQVSSQPASQDSLLTDRLTAILANPTNFQPSTLQP